MNHNSFVSVHIMFWPIFLFFIYSSFDFRCVKEYQRREFTTPGYRGRPDPLIFPRGATRVTEDAANSLRGAAAVRGEDVGLSKHSGGREENEVTRGGGGGEEICAKRGAADGRDNGSVAARNRGVIGTEKQAGGGGDLAREISKQASRENGILKGNLEFEVAKEEEMDAKQRLEEHYIR